MCGIVGVYNMNGSSVDPQVLTQMLDIQRHRGPDDRGTRLFSLRKREGIPTGFEVEHLTNGKFEGGVGCNRLSILDLSENGHQPMCNQDGSVFIVYNGEVYNAFQYRSELEASGFCFKSDTDTEVILYLYERFGFVDMLERLNGMFAMCIVDLRQQKIYLARDRMGIKPLYWYEQKGTFLFSSEVKSFLWHPNFRTEFNIDRLDEYFVFRYCAGDGYLLKGVHQLEPGHWMELNPDGWKQHKYWVIPDCSNKSNLSFDSALGMLENQLQRSVQLQLLSDVKVGCQFSGGIDSSLISIFAGMCGGADMDAFSIVSEDPQISEEKWIDKAGSMAKIRGHKYTLDSNYFFENLGAATWHMDQPLSQPNSLGIFYLAEKSRPNITVFLSGEGADELFGGYTRFMFAMLRPKLNPWLPILRQLPYFGAKCATKFGTVKSEDRVGWFVTQAQCAFQHLDHFLSARPGLQIDRVVSERRAIFEQGNGDYISNCFKYELKTYLVDLLIRQDKMTMAHSMENRVPFLDHELVTIIRSLPSEFLVKTSPGFRQVRMRNTKVLLKKLALKYFSSEIVYRMKSGFGLPLRLYFTQPRFRSILEDILLPGMHNRGVVDAALVERWCRNMVAGGEDTSEALWVCVAFEMWAQQYLDGGWRSKCQSKPSKILTK